MVGLTLVDWESPALDPAKELGELEMSGRRASVPSALFTEPSIAGTCPFEQDSAIHLDAALRHVVGPSCQTVGHKDQ